MTLVDAVDSRSNVTPIGRCFEPATRIRASDLALHSALCLWCSSLGQAGASRALSGAALSHRNLVPVHAATTLVRGMLRS
jgi:hypothetical protein